jgi:hypothetical protein
MKATRGAVKIYNGGVETRRRRIGSRSQSCDFKIYNYNASIVVGYLHTYVERFSKVEGNIFVFLKRTRLLVAL